MTRRIWSNWGGSEVSRIHQYISSKKIWKRKEKTKEEKNKKKKKQKKIKAYYRVRLRTLRLVPNFSNRSHFAPIPARKTRRRGSPKSPSCQVPTLDINSFTIPMQPILLKPLFVFILANIVSASIFDFFQNQFHHGSEEPASYEQKVLDNQCEKYLCPDTLECVSSPKKCPCPFPSSQMRCPLPNGNFICISKPAGDFGGKYDDPEKNFKVDANSNDIRDCGWVKRAWNGKL